jgi:hypothetical protein
MIIEEGYLGYLKYEGNDVNDGIMDARDSATALLGFDEAFRFFINREHTAWSTRDLNLPVRIGKGCWQILIPTALTTVFAGYYLKAMATKAGTDGFFETGMAKDLHRVLKAALTSLKWVIKISKHLGAIGDVSRLGNAKLQDLDSVIIYNNDNEPLLVARKYFEQYRDCPSDLLTKCASVICLERMLEIGSFEQNMTIDFVTIAPAERSIFCQDASELPDIVLPELEHGMSVELEGEITRVTESTNTLGFCYDSHVLICKSSNASKIASFKSRIISQQDNHIFPRVKLIGTIDRKDDRGGFKAHKPSILFSDIVRLETPPGTLL